MNNILPKDTSKKEWYYLNAAFYPYGGTKVRYSRKIKDGRQWLYFFEDDSGQEYAHGENEYLFTDNSRFIK